MSIERSIVVDDELRARVEAGDFVRVSGNSVCKDCRRELWRHTNLEEPYQFLTYLCDGRLVKL